MIRGIPTLEDLERQLGSLDGQADPRPHRLQRAARGRRHAITDDFRIRAALPTIEWLTERGANVVTASHLGRPKGAPNPKYSMDPVRTRLAELAPGVELLENLRFDPGEEGNDPAFVERLVAGDRRLRERCVRCVAPGPRLDRRPAASRAVGDGPAAGARRSRSCSACATTRSDRSSPCSAVRR